MRTHPMEDAPHDGTKILAFRWNGCGWEAAVVWWTGKITYPWQSGMGDAYPEDRLDCWQHIVWPKDQNQ